tara:strand:+ start:3480 stop:3614 length:135 start_codon:yes stop_codon:yes gene_type:complete
MMFLFYLATELKKSLAEILELSTLEIAGWKHYYDSRVKQQKAKG